ncbi:hypothetical protein [Acetobacter persici]|uniref:Abi-alpha family protein n=1 Tax=Acetobacter persici TaxID=1076596 RepID=UPI0039E7ABDC
MVALTIAGTVAAFNYIDDQTNNALSSYAKHRFETAADYVTNGAWKKLVSKTNEKLKGKTIEQDPNLEFVDEILEKTKLQTDDKLLDLWASLLANAMQGKNSIRREYFDILSKLNPYDVLTLNMIMDDILRKNIVGLRRNGLVSTFTTAQMDQLSEIIDSHYGLDIKSTDFRISLLYLQKLELISNASDPNNWTLTLSGNGLKEALTV